MLLQEGDGVSITAIREIMLLRELRHPNIVSLEAVHVSRKVCSFTPFPSSALIEISV